MADPVRKTDRHYTYADYVTWPDDERWELIDGVAFNMSAAPLRNHQKILGDLHVLVRAALKPGGCEAYLAPFDVFILSATDDEADRTDTIVEPDLVVVCDPSKLIRRGCAGAPDWVVEILSTWTMRKDITVKLELYERAGVLEYWVIDPGNEAVMVYLLDDTGRYPPDPALYHRGNSVRGVVVPELTVDLDELFGAEA
ncbi:MAG: Uma2 family endonuclease [Spirochaetaceae bacterium]|nr:Uma2 family endonuclease [Spirochaetaceae bacterium]